VVGEDYRPILYSALRSNIREQLELLDANNNKLQFLFGIYLALEKYCEELGEFLDVMIFQQIDGNEWSN